MKEYIVEFFYQGTSTPQAARVFAMNEAQARTNLKMEKGQSIIIRTTKEQK